MRLIRALPLAVGCLALLATIALLVVHVLLAIHVTPSLPVRATSIMSAVSESVLLIVVGWMCIRYLSSTRSGTSKRPKLVFYLSLLLCISAAALSMASLICLRTRTIELTHEVLGANKARVLAGSAIVLGMAVASQLVFVVMHFVWPPVASVGGSGHLYTRRTGQLPQMKVRSVRYSQTATTLMGSQNARSMDWTSPPRSSSGKSATDTASSLRSSLSMTVRPIASKTRLLSTRDKYRSSSLDSKSHREGSIATQDSFDSWDTSTVDPQNRLTVLGTASPAPQSRFLETIPASPTPSRSPSPGYPLDLEPPRPCRRSRSFSPAPRPQPDPKVEDEIGELNIHPLFRSDSPVPPPNVTANTVVTAAPDAARSISDRHSVRRMRSSSLPVRESPLSHQSSFETFRAPPSVDEREEVSPGADGAPSPSERQLTPPIPEWVLSAGSRSSLSEYQSRKLRLSAFGHRSSP